MLSGRISSFLRYLKKFKANFWRTETCIYNLCDALMSARADNLIICYRKKQIDVSFSVLLLTMNFVITFSKFVKLAIKINIE